MYEGFQKFGEEFQKAGKDSFEATVRSLGEVNKGLQAIAAKFADYSKKSFEDGTRAFEQLIGAKSVEQAIEIQSQFAKKAYDTYIAEMSKLGEMYVAVGLKSVTSRLKATDPSSHPTTGANSTRDRIGCSCGGFRRAKELSQCNFITSVCLCLMTHMSRILGGSHPCFTRVFAWRLQG